MINSSTGCSAETTSGRADMTDYCHDLPTIVRQVRVCRSMLGAILDEFECGAPTQDALDGIGEATLNLSAEIENLWAKVKKP
jgi:hypothetical protein